MFFYNEDDSEVSFENPIDPFYNNSSIYRFTNQSLLDEISGRDLYQTQQEVVLSQTEGAIFQLNAANTLETTGTTDLLNNDYHTVAIRIKINNSSNGSWTRIFSYWSDSVFNATNNGWTAANNPGIIMTDQYTNILWNYPNEPAPSPQLDINVGQWYDIIGIKNGQYLTIYWNGNLHSVTQVKFPNSPGESRIILGANPTMLSAGFSVKQLEIYPKVVAVEDFDKILI